MSDPTDPPKPAYKPGDVLVVAAPASSGLPLNARAIVASVNKYDGVQHKYDVTLTGGGAREPGEGGGVAPTLETHAILTALESGETVYLT